MNPNCEASPVQSEGFGERIRSRFFYSPISSILSIGIGTALVLIAVLLFKWGILDAVWAPDLQMCRSTQGACWGFVAEKWRLILFGRFPYEEQWRAATATLLVVLMLIATAVPALWRKPRARCLLLGWVIVLGAFFVLMYGGVAGLSSVDTDMWGGLPLTIIVTLIGMGVSSPIGIFLAIGRRSRLPAISFVSTAYIELVRGVPLITVLFVATFVFPLLLPSWMQIDAFWRVTWAIVLFQAAYMAETVRGGLQTVPQGQIHAAKSLGLTTVQCYVHVILPQALAAIIPAFVNSLISCFLDTSLVTIVSMYDLTGSLRLALGDAQWRAFFIEGYIFIAAVYFVSSFAVSRYSQWLERRVLVGQRHSSH